MTALGFVYPGHSAGDDYPRIEQLLGSDIRVDLVHTETGGDPREPHALRRLGTSEELAAVGEQLRLSGAEAVVWASTSGSFGYGRQGAHEQVSTLARTAGMPASSTSFAFVHAVRELRVTRVAVAAPYPEDVAGVFADFLRDAGVEVVNLHATDLPVKTFGELLGLARAADHPTAGAVLLPGTCLRTAAHIPALEKTLAKPVLTANQVSVWEALRLTGRRVNEPALGALFTREPIVQV